MRDSWRSCWSIWTAASSVTFIGWWWPLRWHESVLFESFSSSTSTELQLPPPPPCLPQLTVLWRSELPQSWPNSPDWKLPILSFRTPGFLWLKVLASSVFWIIQLASQPPSFLFSCVFRTVFTILLPNQSSRQLSVFDCHFQFGLQSPRNAFSSLPIDDPTHFFLHSPSFQRIIHLIIHCLWMLMSFSTHCIYSLKKVPQSDSLCSDPTAEYPARRLCKSSQQSCLSKR